MDFDVYKDIGISKTVTFKLFVIIYLLGFIGYIAEKEALPIRQLKFGKHPLFDPDYDYGKFTLGKLECSGRVKVNGLPTSCRDMYRIGHTLNDFYSIKKNEKIETVFCDFSLSPFDPSK